MPYTPPTFKSSSFNCPLCNAFAHFRWMHLQTANHYTRAWLAACAHCAGSSLWWAEDDTSAANIGRMLVPAQSNVPNPHPDMPPDVAADYAEARTISVASPRAACALLRVAIERLCTALKAEGDSINSQIGFLVKQGLPVQIQQALDAVRVVGNNAVHPGKMDPDDVAEISTTLFALVNLIVEDRITRPKMVAAVFDALPDGARKAIERRDS